MVLVVDKDLAKRARNVGRSSTACKVLGTSRRESMAQRWHDQVKRREARDLLAPVYGWFTEGFDTPDLKEARALLDTLA